MKTQLQQNFALFTESDVEICVNDLHSVEYFFFLLKILVKYGYKIIFLCIYWVNVI